MSATILPFPTTRRHGFIHRQARRAAEINPAAGERYIQRQIGIQRDTMERRGIAPKVVQNEIQAFESAIRSALWCMTFGVGGGDA